MKIVIAPDSFKECLPARQVASVLASAFREFCPGCEVVEMPLADGGEGTAEILTAALGGRMCTTTVTGPLGEPVEARFGVAGELGLMEVASACGLTLVPPERRDPLSATTAGVGELILAALEEGCRHIVVGLGGSATCDGGEGMLSVPGLRSAASGVRFTVLCDVDTPFLGRMGAARVFGPQKGASPSDVEVLEQRMVSTAERFWADTGVDVRSMPGAGAAGGLGGAFAACLGAELVPGVEEVLRLTGFDQAVAGAGWIVTGEGRSDRQTLAGKVPCGVLQHASSAPGQGGTVGIPVALLSGCIEDTEALSRAGFRHLVQVSPPDLPLAEALRPSVAAANLRLAVSRLLKAQ